MTKKLKAMTLTELLVVIAIIGILAAMVFTALGPVKARSRDSKRISDLQMVSVGLEKYYAQYHHYPWYSTTDDSTTEKDYINLNTDPGTYNQLYYKDATNICTSSNEPCAPCALHCNPNTVAKKDFQAMATELFDKKYIASVPVDSKDTIADYGFRYEGGDCTNQLTIAVVLETSALQKDTTDTYNSKPQYSIKLANIQVNDPQTACTP